MLNIKGLLLGNFRVFSDTSCFRLAPITVLTGPNSSGKSTITGSLTLMKNLNTCSLPYKVRLDSGKNPFGSFDMIAGKNSRDKVIKTGYDLYNIILGENVRVVFTFEKGRNFEASVKNISIRYNGGNLFDFTFDQNRIQTRVGLKYLYDKLSGIKKEKNHYLEMENNFRQIRSSSGTFKEGPAVDEENQMRIFHVDNDLKRKNLSEYLKNNNIPEAEYERLFYFYGKHRILPGNDGTEAELTRKAGRIITDFTDDQILFNNELLIKMLDIPAETFDTKSIRGMISKEFPELFDCLVLLNNPDSLNNIVELLRRKNYDEWEKDYLEIEVASSKRMKGIESAGELSSAIDHHLQSRFDKSRFFRAVTELSMTREGFIQSYHRYKNVRTLSSFCSLVLEKIMHDLQTDLDRSVNVQLRDLNPVMSVDFDHPLHDLIRNYSMMRGKDNFLKNWFRKLNICDDLLIDIPARGMGYFPGLMKNEEKNSLATEGSGTGRLLMMLLGIANARHHCDLRDYNEDLQYYPGTIILEQPESGLHPSWQSKLADMFADAKKEFGLHFVIETHSEYIINKLQYLVATGKLSKDDVLIYYLDNRSKDGSPKPVEITLDKSGNLSQDIPGGFLDEEDCRSLGLFRLKRVSRN
ncbi:MAG: AAA family ATPase [Chloroflexota bacterium]